MKTSPSTAGHRRIAMVKVTRFDESDAMPYLKILERSWLRDQVAIDLHAFPNDKVYAMGFEAAREILYRRCLAFLRARHRDLVEKNVKVALNYKLNRIFTMPQQIKATEFGAHAAVDCDIEDIERAFRDEWWTEHDDRLEREAKEDKNDG